MGAAPVLRYKNTEVPRQAGEVGRLRVIEGPDKGLVCLLRNSTVVLGRGEKSDIMISDLKASRSHARLEFTKEGWVVNDLGSANGIFYHGEYVRKFPILSGERFTLGDTIFEFMASSESTRVLMSPMRPSLEVVQQDHALAQQRAKVRTWAQPAEAAKDPTKKQNPARTLLLVAVLAGGYFFMNQDPPQKGPQKAPQKKEEQGEAAKGLENYLPPGVTKDIQKTAEQYYRLGFREYREGNYLRAKSQFELALQVNPGHALARHYLAVSDKEIETSIKDMIQGAEKAITAGRLREAKGYYETAMRLMYYDRSNPDFIECEEEVKKINKELNKVP